MAKTLPEDAAERKALPLQSGVLDYFPAALVEVAKVSKAGNDQHNPGQPLHWNRGKSNDHADSLQRHQLEHGTVDTDGLLHSAKVAWRALAQLQMELEAAGAPIARGATVGVPPAWGQSGGAPNILVPVSNVNNCDDVEEWTADQYYIARWTARDQGELRVHCVGVCSHCDRIDKTLPRHFDMFMAGPAHLAKP